MPKSRRIPILATDSSELYESNGSEKKTHPISGSTTNCALVSYDNKLWIYKAHGMNRKHPEWEVALAESLWTMLGPQRASRSRLIINKSNQNSRVGLISEYHNNFQPLAELQQQNPQLNHQYLIEQGLMTIVVGSYIIENTDLHAGNFGSKLNKPLVLIDPGRAAWSNTAKYFTDSNTEITEFEIKKNDHLKSQNSSPQETFIVVEADLLILPVLHHAKPFKWVDRNFFAVSDAAHTCLANATQQQQKWHEFAKQLIMLKLNKSAIAEDCFTTEKGEKKFINWLSTRINALETALLKLPEFCATLIKDEALILKQLENHIQAHNFALASNEKHRLIDPPNAKRELIGLVKQAFERITRSKHQLDAIYEKIDSTITSLQAILQAFMVDKSNQYDLTHYQQGIATVINQVEDDPLTLRLLNHRTHTLSAMLHLRYLANTADSYEIFRAHHEMHPEVEMANTVPSFDFLRYPKNPQSLNKVSLQNNLFQLSQFLHEQKNSYYKFSDR